MIFVMVRRREELDLEANWVLMKNYNTLTEAITGLTNRGYSVDFNLAFAGILGNAKHFSLARDKFVITEVHRFEGDTNPDDQAVIYAIESNNGIKGILVNGYGISTDPVSDKLIEALLIRRS